MGQPAKMTLAEFLEWEEQQAERYEFHEGDAFPVVGSTARQNRVVLNLASRIADHLDGSPCQVFAQGVKVLADEHILYPDLMVTCGRAMAGDELIVEDPALVVEVLSPGTEGYDRRDKFILFRSLPSLRQFVLIDPVDRRVEVHTRAGEYTWTLVDQSKATQFTLSSVGLNLPMEALFRGVERAA